MRSLAQAEALARHAIARRQAEERTRLADQRLADITTRLHAAEAVVAARHARAAAVAAVLHTPGHLEMPRWPHWLDVALEFTNESGDAYMVWTDWSTA